MNLKCVLDKGEEAPTDGHSLLVSFEAPTPVCVSGHLRRYSSPVATGRLPVGASLESEDAV